MSEELNTFAEESGQDPEEVKRFVRETYNEIFPVINQVDNAGDAVELFKRWERVYNNDGQFSILDALAVFEDLSFISTQAYESTLMLLDYASSHGVIELDCSQFVERKEPSSPLKPEITIEKLRQAVINDYAFLCADDGGTTADEISLEDYKKSVSEMTWEQLMEETSVNTDKPTGNPFDMTLEEYVEHWEAKSEYADLNYIRNVDGSTYLSEDKQ